GQHDAHAKLDRIARPEIGPETLQRAQPLGELLLRFGEAGDRRPADHARTMRAHSAGPMRGAGGACGAIAMARVRVKRQLNSSAQPANAAPQKYGLLRPNASNSAPAVIGPITRARLPTDCASP